ncbi:MAG: hypothetical protein IKK26_04005 [Clostridia bacterium]|nr:hypothetical protein [Clostridia bacterium]
MKKFICLIMTAVMCALLCACAANPKCEYDAAIAALSKAEEVNAYVYNHYANGEEYTTAYTIDGKTLAEMIGGEWEKTSRPKNMNKAISITIGTQYEICIFEDNSAIIYCGYAGVFESDRQYYSFKNPMDIRGICNYVYQNGEEVVIEE